MASLQDEIGGLYRVCLKNVADAHGDKPLSTDDMNALLLQYEGAAPGRARLLKDCDGLGWRDKETDKGKRVRLSTERAALLWVGHKLEADKKHGTRSDIWTSIGLYQKQIAKPSLWQKKTEIGATRTENIVLSRAFGCIISRLGGLEKLPQDCFIIVERGPSKKNGVPSAVISAEQLQTILGQHNGDRDVRYAMTGLGGEVYLISSPDAREFAGRRYIRLEFAAEVGEFMAMTIGPSPSERGYSDLLETMNREAQLLSKPAENSFGQLVARLLRTVLVYWPEVKRDILGQSPPETQTDHAPRQLPNLSLFPMTKLIQTLISKETGLRCFCDIMAQKKETEAVGGVLQIQASSAGKPWNLGASQEELLPGQFLSGAVFIANCGALVEDTRGVRRRLISYLDRERVDAAVAFPSINPYNGQPNGAAYVGLYFDDKDADGIASAIDAARQLLPTLRVLGLCVGEIIQREGLVSRTVESIASLTRSEILSETAFAAKVKEVVSRLDTKIGRCPTMLRLPFVLFFSLTDAESEVSQEIASWLQGQLPLLSLEGDLLRFSTSAGVGHDEMVVGRIGKTSAIATMVTRLVDKREIRLLREIPTRRNNLPPLWVERDGIRVRIGAWVYDFSARAIMEMASKGDSEPSRVMLEKLGRWSRVAPYVIRTYKYSHWSPEMNRADWIQAREEARKGLELDDENAYLLRRAAECSLVLGDLTAAEDYARRSFDSDPEHVRSACLVGDVHLASANGVAAIEQYRKAAQIDSQHPLPYYSAGFAMLSIAKVVRDRAIQSLKGDEVAPRLGSLKDQLTAADHLLVIARGLFGKAGNKLGAWDYEGSERYEEDVYAPANGAAIGESALLAGDVDAAVPELVRSLENHPNDERLLRELIRTRLSHRDNAEKLGRQLLEIEAAAGGGWSGERTSAPSGAGHR